jgi:NADPH-dependent 2,4-dienoyl-CoA reductase/sulfur reductase-like enzyme
LLLATGGSPRRLPSGDDVIYFRTVADYLHLRELADSGKSFVVIGGGFIGSEIAAALTMRGSKVTMLFPEHGIGARIFPSELSAFLNGYYREKGVDVCANEMVSSIKRDGDKRIVETKNGKKVTADVVVAGLGIAPNTDLAESAGLKVDDGIIVDEHLRTSNADIFAAGDVARFNAPALGKRIRVEHEDNANTMGKAAGRAMAGDTTPYNHLPFFYSDLFDMGYEAVGETDSRLETFADWKEPNREGVVYYMSEGRVRGAVLWNMFGKVDEARAVIAEERNFTPQALKGRISAG